jgi:cytochrome b involved in lipid metabolism
VTLSCPQTGYFILNNFSYPSINSLRLGDDAPSLVPYSEVKKHNTRASCWVIVEGRIYDVTSVIDTHPGGAAAILKHAGKDST